MTANLLDELNKSQREAVEYCDGPQLVIAGAGSGKTRVLTYKIAYLLRQGMKPWNILALTFTNKAAREMKERIGRLVGSSEARYLNMGTFHSIFARILRNEAAVIGYTPNYTIYDESDSRSLIKNIIKAKGLDDKKYKPAAVHSRISMAKNRLISAADYAADSDALDRDDNQNMGSLHEIYADYTARCRQANAMDFDDLLFNTFKLLREHEDVRKKYAERFQYILVDEYQDTNAAQQAIMLLLAKDHHRVCVVGDDYQSIYSFRGANIDNILDFQNRFPESRLFKLERNYRSTQSIVEAASSLMKHNERQIPKDVYSKGDEGERVVYKPAYSDKEEAAIVANDINTIKRKDSCEYGDFAILYRTNAQSRSFEEELRRQGIPYQIFGGLSFYQRKEIKDIIAYFRLISNPDDEQAFLRVINYPARGIGNTTIQKIVDMAGRNSVSLWQTITSPDAYGLDVNKGTMNKLAQFRSLIDGFISRAADTDVYELGKDVIKQSGISADLYSSSDPEYLSRQENLDEFLSSMQDFVASRQEEGREHEVLMSDFLAEVSLLTDQDKNDDGGSKVTLMTIHAAKGLEFPTVFVVGLEENIFPSPMSATSKRELEEERRLLYVAITRAERHCILTNARNRYRYGSMQYDVPSRFLADIDPKLLDSRDESGDSAVSSNGYGGEMPWDRKPRRPWDDSPRQRSDYQNSRPVADRFMADPKPKITSSHVTRNAADLFGARKRIQRGEDRSSLRRIKSGPAESVRSLQSAEGELYEGTVIEHQRFGIGTVTRLEGTGENAKATVEFRNTGTKQLLLKFARFKIVG